ncbi:hypothetical protein CEQ90_10560 [Lewinellaceae bacterium SD302]|nr:hypothetical protein CEQ90_10560 [Lewinellaceae bacterium SD302]
MMNVKIFFIFLLTWVQSCDQTNLESFSYPKIAGFWKCQYSDDLKYGPPFCEVTDSTFNYWNDDAGFLPSYNYIVSNDSLFFNGVNNVDRKPDFIGKIHSSSESSFQLIRSTDTIVFEKSSKEYFFNETGESW